MLYYNRLQVYRYCTCVKGGYSGIAVYHYGQLILYTFDCHLGEMMA